MYDYLSKTPAVGLAERAGSRGAAPENFGNPTSRGALKIAYPTRKFAHFAHAEMGNFERKIAQRGMVTALGQPVRGGGCAPLQA